MTKLILAFDTTGVQDSMALFHGGEIVSQLFRPDVESSNKTSPKGSSQWQSSMLVPALQSFLGKHGVSFQDVDTICTLTGPGSFTGIRIGLAAAQGLLIAKACQVFAPTTLHLLLFIGEKMMSETAVSCPLVAVVDSKRGDYFAMRRGEDDAEIMTKDQLLLFVTQGGRVVSSELVEGIDDVLQSTQPLAASLIAFNQHLGGASQVHFTVLEPFYLRTPEFAKKKSCLTSS
jgi:tRNA threonylcarbamoyladenosine biosynthesis protein TsaB